MSKKNSGRMLISRALFAVIATVATLYAFTTFFSDVSSDVKCTKGSPGCTQKQERISEDINDQDLPLLDDPSAENDLSTGPSDHAIENSTYPDSFIEQRSEGGGVLDTQREREFELDDDEEQDTERIEETVETDNSPNKTLTRAFLSSNTFIRVRGDDFVRVYVNGIHRKTVRKSDRTKTIKTYLGPGDVVGFVGINKRGWGGVLIDIFYKNQHHYSGKDKGFKTRRFPRSGWNTKSRSSCSWHRAKAVPGGSKGGLLRKAKYIWEKSTSRIGRVNIRYVVGGEVCTVPSLSPSPGPITSYIQVRADDYVFVYLNGAPLRFVQRQSGARKIRVRLGHQDVVSFMAVNEAAFGGVLIDVFHNGLHHYSGISGSFKAHVHRKGQLHLLVKWRTKKFKSCNWKQPKKISGGPTSPFPAGAKYIWAKGAPRKATITIRYVVGGEYCPTPSPTPASFIRVRSNTFVILYLNGRILRTMKKSDGIQTIPVPLRIDDVVAFTALHSSNRVGVLIDVYYSQTHHYSGASGFYKVLPMVKTGPSDTPQHWKTRRFSSCLWKKPTKVNGGGKESFPTRADYIWSKNQQSSAVLIRHVVGGEKCPLHFIRVRADDYVFVYVNGRSLKAVTKGQGLQKIPTPLRKGDVVAFRVVNRHGWGGILIDIFHNRKHHYSGIDKKYKAIKLSVLGPIGKRYSTKGFSSCSWHKPKLLHTDSESSFPPQAKYIWAKGTPKKSTIVVRYVVGGETCTPKPTRSVKPSTSPRSSQVINGYSGSDDHCPCRKIPNEKSFCYTMDKELERAGDCSSHKCADKYECLRGAKGLPDCVRRYAEYHVLKIGTDSTSGKLQCKQLKLKPKTEFWVLY